MSDVQQSVSSERGDQPGKTRTMWHPVLVRLLDYALGSAFTVREEVSVGKMPLRLDILLIRREEGQLSELQRQELAALLPLLNRFTLIEFKGPTDAMKRGDFGQLVGRSYLWQSQESEPIPHEEVSLVVLTPTVNNALREELRLLGFEARQHEPGIFRVIGLPFATWLMETDVMAEREQPVLSLVSRVFLNDGRGIIKRLARAGHSRLASYAAQQIGRFYRSEDFVMQFTDSGYVDEVDDDVLAEILGWIPLARRLEGFSPEEVLRALPPEDRLRGLPAEERVRGLPAEERVRGLSAEERLAGLSDEEAARLRELLEQRRAR